MTGNELKTYGFKFDRVKYCCGGAKNEIYRHGEYELRIRPRHDIFQIRLRGSSLTAFLPLNQLKQKLDDFGLLQAVETASQV